MNRKTLAAAALAVAATLGVAPAAAQAAPTPSQRTCAAFAAWERHRTAAGLDAVMTASLHAPWKYLGEDADDLYRAVRSHRGTSTAERYLGEDCHGVA